MTYSVLMDVASQRQRDNAARARAPRFGSVPRTTTGRHGKRDRARVPTSARGLLDRA
jgi:hypothetical protein